MDITYLMPSSVDEAARRKAEVGIEIQNIQMQLGDKTRNVDRFWQRKARFALLAKIEEHGRLRDYLRQNKHEVGSRRAKRQAKGDLMLKALAVLMRRLPTLDDEEDGILDRIEQTLDEGVAFTEGRNGHAG